MNSNIALLLAQDGLTNGLVYALMALSILLVFVVTRVLWVPAGDFLMLGALSLALFQQGVVPGTVWLTGCLGLLCALVEGWRAWRRGNAKGLPTTLLLSLGIPLAAGALSLWLAPIKPPLLVQVALVIGLVAPIGYIVYRVVFQPLADRPTLTLMFVAVAVHYALTGLGLIFFGSEGFRTPPFIPGRIDIGVTRVSWQLMLVFAASAVLMLALWHFFGRSLWGKALRATAVNRFGARLVGIRTNSTGALAFTLAAAIGAFSGVLIGPVTTLYYDSGFLVSLKGFVGAVIGGLASFPLAVLGAVLVGLVESFAAFYASPFKEAIVFGLLIPFLLWRSATQPRRHEDEEH
ncbi:branched-chain amino acid ABC transporter permease [Microbaculum sp. FT89]|uniref:branched-chain amino acid ABC transporter permease n=1 Tax=Microbaculum sp. FT89 TaxID=3447298 RepID=UPI003F5363EE